MFSLYLFWCSIALHFMILINVLTPSYLMVLVLRFIYIIPISAQYHYHCALYVVKMRFKVCKIFDSPLKIFTEAVMRVS